MICLDGSVSRSIIDFEDFSHLSSLEELHCYHDYYADMKLARLTETFSLTPT